MQGYLQIDLLQLFFCRVLYVVYVSVESYVLCIRLKCSVLFYMSNVNDIATLGSWQICVEISNMYHSLIGCLY